MAKKKQEWYDTRAWNLLQDLERALQNLSSPLTRRDAEKSEKAAAEAWKCFGGLSYVLEHEHEARQTRK